MKSRVTRYLKCVLVIAVIVCAYCFCINNYNVEAQYEGTTKVTAQIIAPSTAESSQSSSIGESSNESSGSAIVTGDNAIQNICILIIVLICCIATIIFMLLRKNKKLKF